MGRRFGVEVADGVGLSATVIVIPYPEALLTKAQELIVNGDFSIAVVVAHMACENVPYRAPSLRRASDTSKSLSKNYCPATIWRTIAFAISTMP
jgi:hypothetical protein